MNDKLLIISEDWFRSLLDNLETNPYIRKEKKNISTGYSISSVFAFLVLSLVLLVSPVCRGFITGAKEATGAEQFIFFNHGFHSCTCGGSVPSRDHDFGVVKNQSE